MDCAHYQYGQDPDSTGPLGVDYIYLGTCVFGPQVSILMLLWAAFLIAQTAITADKYFSPTLQLVSQELKLPLNVAGVTFLAFGNGAPDFFSLLASVTGGVNILVPMGSLLGGEVFISTVVVGTIALLSPSVLTKEILYRDILFFAIAVTAIMLIAILGCVPLWLSICYFVIYLIYVGFVLVGSWFGDGQNGAVTNELIHNIAGDIGLTRFDNESIQTAFWHRDAAPASATVVPTTGTAIGPAGSKSKVPPFKAPVNPSQSSGGYSFLILSSDDDNEGKDDTQRDLESGVINISGGFEPDFDLIIKENFFSLENAGTTRNTTEVGRSLAATGYSVQDDDAETDAEGNSDSSSLEERLLPGGGRSFQIGSDETESGRARARKFHQRGIIENNAVLTALYWQQWSLQRQFQRSPIAAEWASYPWWYKLFLLVDYPWTMLRDLTIPTLNPDNWSKFHAVAHPIIDPLFIAYFLGFSEDTVEGIPMVVLCLLISVVPAGVIFLFTLKSRPPTSSAFTVCWTVSAFSMCIVWIYILASELVTCLSALGTILGVPPAFLGLTVLAWGNSAGDFFNNTSLAKEKMGEMALAGCYGGPVFNILCGMSIGLSIASYQTFPAPYPLKLDAACIISIGFLYASLGYTVLYATYNNYKVDRQFGIGLLSLYAVYTVVQITLVSVN